MDALPTELRHEVLSHVSLASLKALRLVSRSWAVLGADYLIYPDLVVKQHRDDCNRLLDLSQHETLSNHVRKLTFEMGEVDEYHARHNSYFIQYMTIPEERDESSGRAWAEYRRINKLKQAYAESHCDSEILHRAMKGLGRLENIEINLSKCPYDDPLWHRIWKIPTSRHLPRVVTTQRFTSILTAASACKLRTLSHDRLPFEFWGQNLGLMEQIAEMFRHLETVKIVSDYSARPNEHRRDECFARLGQCLKSAPDLKDIYLGFWTSTKPLLTFSTCIGDDFIWPKLHTFCLEGVKVHTDDLASFLLRHRSSLKRLQLGGTGQKHPRVKMVEGLNFESGTFHGLCKQLQGLKLEKFNVRPFLGSSPFGLSTEDNEPLYDDSWNRVVGLGDSRSARLETFVLGAADWPGPEESPMDAEPLQMPDDFL